MTDIAVSRITPEGMRHIAQNLRPRDRREIFALRWGDDEGQFVFDVCQVAGDLWQMWWIDNEPVAVNGVIPLRPGVISVGAFGTPKMRGIIKPLTRYTLVEAIPLLKRSGIHRAEAYVLAENTDSRAWIKMLGGEIEAVLKGYGRGREDFLLYTWDLTRERGDDHVLFQQRQGAVRSPHANGYS